MSLLDDLSTAASLSPCRKSFPPVKASVRRHPNDHMSAGVDGFGGVLKDEVLGKPDRRRTFLQSWVSPPPSFSSSSPLLPLLLLSSLLLSSVSPSQERREEHCDLSELSWHKKERVLPVDDRTANLREDTTGLGVAVEQTFHARASFLLLDPLQPPRILLLVFLNLSDLLDPLPCILLLLTVS